MLHFLEQGSLSKATAPWAPLPLAPPAAGAGVLGSAASLPTRHDPLTGRHHFVHTNGSFPFLCASVDTPQTPVCDLPDASQGLSSITQHALSTGELTRATSWSSGWAGPLSPSLCDSVNTHGEGATGWGQAPGTGSGGQGWFRGKEL